MNFLPKHPKHNKLISEIRWVVGRPPLRGGLPTDLMYYMNSYAQTHYLSEFYTLLNSLGNLKAFEVGI